MSSIVAAGLAALLVPRFDPRFDIGSAEITTREIEGESAWTIRARSVAADRMLEELATRSERRVTGLDRIDTARLREPVAIELSDRSLAYVVHVLAGTIGARARLRADEIELLQDVDDQSSATQVDEVATVAWMRLLKDHPSHALAAQGEMALGELQERAGDLASACGHYLLVVRNHPRSELVADALLRAGLIQARLADWAAAAETFSSLANLDRAHPHPARARVELARALAHRGDGRQSLFLLDALERLFPTTVVEEREVRLLVRARALSVSGRHAETLEAIERAEALDPAVERDPDAMELRAAALEHFGRPAEAARAWLACVESQTGDARDRALVEAARLAYSAGDDVGVLFVAKLASDTRAGVAIADYAAQARERLGLSGQADARMRTEDLARAEDLIVARSFARARAILERLWREREAFDQVERLRLALAYARALDAEEGLDSALAILRTALPAFDAAGPRLQIHVLAGELFERHGRFDEAVAAYGGNF